MLKGYIIFRHYFSCFYWDDLPNANDFDSLLSFLSLHISFLSLHRIKICGKSSLVENLSGDIITQALLFVLPKYRHEKKNQIIML